VDIKADSAGEGVKLAAGSSALMRHLMACFSNLMSPWQSGLCRWPVDLLFDQVDAVTSSVTGLHLDARIHLDE